MDQKSNKWSWHTVVEKTKQNKQNKRKKKTPISSDNLTQNTDTLQVQRLQNKKWSGDLLHAWTSTE